MTGQNFKSKCKHVRHPEGEYWSALLLLPQHAIGLGEQSHVQGHGYREGESVDIFQAVHQMDSTEKLRGDGLDLLNK